MPRALASISAAFLFSCAPRQPAPADPGPAIPDAPLSTSELLSTFFAEHGGRDAFGEPAATALEVMLLAEDDVAAGDLASAGARVADVFARWPHESDAWFHAPPDGLNVGTPVAYYGLRMLEHIVAAGPQPRTGALNWTAIVATCATVTRPTLPDLAPETVQLQLDPEILADDARAPREASHLFRLWVTAITRGLEVNLRIEQMPGCATVGFTDDGSTILSYPDTDAMIAAIPESVARDTDLFWVLGPSGIPGDGSGFNRHFISGGMGGVGARPLFLSDDTHFLIKAKHLGEGRYTTIERRAYQPQWFEHEFMHHLFRTWPELGLEETDHAWFNRSTWPEDFVGRFEADYYFEALEKRLLGATPTLADALQGATYADMNILALSAIAGDFRREPTQNDWHVVSVTVDGARATWTNAAGATWSLQTRGSALYTGPDCPYGEQRVEVELGDAGEVTALWFGGERYGRSG